VSILKSQSIVRPDWMSGELDWSLLCSGVLYVDLDHAWCMEYIYGTTLVAAWAAVGRHLRNFKAPWVPYSSARLDRNLNLRVADRKYPFNLGDQVWMLVEGPVGLTMVESQVRGLKPGRIYAPTPTTEAGRSPALFASQIVEYAESTAGAYREA